MPFKAMAHSTELILIQNGRKKLMFSQGCHLWTVADIPTETLDFMHYFQFSTRGFAHII